MTENGRRLLEASAAAIKVLLDTLVRHRFTMVDQERAQALSAEIAAALAQAQEASVPVVLKPGTIEAARHDARLALGMVDRTARPRISQDGQHRRRFRAG